MKDEISSLPSIRGFILLLPNSKEGQFSSSHSGSQNVEQTFEEIQLPWGSSLLCMSKRLAHIGRSERCFIPIKHLSSEQEISSFRLPRRMLRIHGSSFRALTESQSVRRWA